MGRASTLVSAFRLDTKNRAQQAASETGTVKGHKKQLTDQAYRAR